MNSFVHTIKFRLILAMGACVALMVSIGMFGVFGIARLNSAVNELYSGNTLPIIDLYEVRATQFDIRLQLRRVQAFRDPGKTSASINAIRADLERMDKAWRHYYPDSITSDQERVIAGKIREGLPQFRDMTNQISAMIGNGNIDAAGEMINRHADFSTALAEFISQDIVVNQAQAKQFTEDSEATYRTIFGIALVLMGIGVLLAIGVSAYLLHSISRPLGNAISIANRIAGGNLENRIVLDSGGEFGELMEALKRMDQQLTDAVRCIKGTAESVTLASRELASGNTDLSARTEEQAASLEETASSMTQLTETVKQNADNARQANGLAMNATDMAGAGDESMQAMVGIIEKISGSSSKISEITGTIEGIAFQTNILALNAAVEAARAGEQGRGFAVVASEVRSLAQRSAVAAKEIKELIRSSVATIQDGVKQAAEVGQTMADVKRAIKQLSDIVGEIATASEEQSHGIEQVNQAVGQMDEVTQQNAALVEQGAAAAQSLEEQAGRLKEAVSVFKLSGTGFLATPTAISPRTPSQVRLSETHPARRAAPKTKLADSDRPATPAEQPTAISSEKA